MTISTSTGVKLYIGGTGPIGDESGYVEVGEVNEIGSIGRSYNLVTAASLSDGIVRKLKGIANAGGGTIRLNFDSANTGQQAILVAAANTSSLAYNFKIELNDQITVSGTPTTYEFKALVMGDPITIGGQDNVVSVETALEVTTVPTRVAAT